MIWHVTEGERPETDWTAKVGIKLKLVSRREETGRKIEGRNAMLTNHTCMTNVIVRSSR